MPAPVERGRDLDENRAEIVALIEKLQREGWHGTLSLVFQRGLILSGRRDQSLVFKKPGSAPT